MISVTDIFSFWPPIMSHSGDISLLRLYMENLPQELPFTELGDKINRLSDFCLDADWVESIGKEMTVNREIEATIFEPTSIVQRAGSTSRPNSTSRSIFMSSPTASQLPKKLPSTLDTTGQPMVTAGRVQRQQRTA
jgi:hypothetical protein